MVEYDQGDQIGTMLYKEKPRILQHNYIQHVGLFLKVHTGRIWL